MNVEIKFWVGPTDYSLIAGHEIAGVVTKVGKNVTRLKVSDHAGISPQCSSCKSCSRCSSSEENLCETKITLTYNDHWPTGDKTFGGYADKWRGDQHSTVGILGIGGLGHFGILFAKAMGATVIGLFSSDRKREAALELGCDDYVVTKNAEAMAKYTNKLTHIICTGVGEDFTWEPYFNILKANGVFINVNAPEFSYPPVPLFMLLFKQIIVKGSLTGTPSNTEEMLQFAADKNIKAWYKKYSMKDVNKVIEDFRAGLPRFRFVLEN
ncbi:hypothetical protein G6F46_007401 [Rhizopus delemar]|uniref:Alcohol dehydrogenase-like C-terminal domain-containing protein n=2 Tax=Rhizopus TaxID=4842 RepID=A0A9P6Z1N6_9FUNG|nr:hypothetical protein G6F55_004865 [Rhizopus delemar]KAG1541973.1 hypothetical protein G6F51_007561 [Rhizopus arrhizus]KAG1496027.1 hypothetical protein G6F54_006763 [Rhizopus delemar]KAG1509839.1 hypothetical protein G6F53_007138 [Rhizopus delemar]KAG1523951.1 hypothetical protein G6F52_004594 [Rhizopus delemar]